MYKSCRFIYVNLYDLNLVDKEVVMQLSKFVVNVENEENYMLYSLKTRKYFIYEKKEQKNCRC